MSSDQLRRLQRKIIFVGGIHGVGKTTLCAFLSSSLHIKHYSAGNLISSYKQEAFRSNKLTDTIPQNQNILIEAIEAILHPNKYYILDGHFCLLNMDAQVVHIPADTYFAISPIAVILLHDDASEILLRLRARDKEKYSEEQLTAFQHEEIAYSRIIAKSLDVPYLLANPFTQQAEVMNFVTTLIKEEIMDESTA